VRSLDEARFVRVAVSGIVPEDLVVSIGEFCTKSRQLVLPAWEMKGKVGLTTTFLQECYMIGKIHEIDRDSIEIMVHCVPPFGNLPVSFWAIVIAATISLGYILRRIWSQRQREHPLFDEDYWKAQ